MVRQCPGWCRPPFLRAHRRGQSGHKFWRNNDSRGGCHDKYIVKGDLSWAMHTLQGTVVGSESHVPSVAFIARCAPRMGHPGRGAKTTPTKLPGAAMFPMGATQTAARVKHVNAVGMWFRTRVQFPPGPPERVGSCFRTYPLGKSERLMSTLSCGPVTVSTGSGIYSFMPGLMLTATRIKP